MLRRVALVRTDASEEISASIIREQKLLVTAKVPISPFLVTLMIKALSSSETSVHTRTTRRNIPEHAILRVTMVFATNHLPRDVWDNEDVCTCSARVKLHFNVFMYLINDPLAHKRSCCTGAVPSTRPLTDRNGYHEVSWACA
jgi:hypothetical protein